MESRQSPAHSSSVLSPSASTQGNATRWSEADLRDVERVYGEGLNVQEIVELFVERGERLTEATFRKYVQHGLLPRSVRVGRKGQRRGSQGLYPPSTVRQLVWVRKLMAQGLTIEEIRENLSFVPGDVELLKKQMKRLFSSFRTSLKTRRQQSIAEDLGFDIERAEKTAEELFERLSSIQRKMMMTVQMERATV